LVTERKRVAEAAAEKEKKEVEAAHEDHQDINDDSDFVADGCVRVCTLSEAEIKNAKLKDILRGHEHIVGADVPLAATPDLRLVRRQLLFEFPYAENVIDFALADLVGCDHVRIRPLLAVGKPGCGKSRFMRRLGETLGVGVWRTDAAQIDGSVFAGTAKRWASAEPSHAFLAVSRAGQANPLVIVDELEKAGTRSDYGRFWDSFLGFLEPETSAHYPDPALQTELDLSHVCYVATANDLAPLPSALLDRFRVMAFPEPRANDLDALLPPVLVDIARERGLDARWVTGLVGWERDIIAKKWGGGSVRRLRRFVETVIRARERDATLQ
jgi:ATP-dependent Lon protease